MPVNFFHGSKSPTENGWFTIRLVQAKQVNNHSIIQKLRSLGGWNRSHKNPQDSGPWWPWSTAWHSQRRSLILPALEFEALSIPVQNVFLQEKKGTQISKRFAIFSTDPEYLSLTMTFLRSVSLAFAVVRIRSWDAWVFGGDEVFFVHHYMASCAINYPCVIEKDTRTNIAERIRKSADSKPRFYVS